MIKKEEKPKCIQYLHEKKMTYSALNTFMDIIQKEKNYLHKINNKEYLNQCPKLLYCDDF